MIWALRKWQRGKRVKTVLDLKKFHGPTHAL